MEKYVDFLKFARSVYTDFVSDSDQLILHKLIHNYNEELSFGFFVHKDVFDKFVDFYSLDVYRYNCTNLLQSPARRIALDNFFTAPYYICNDVLVSSDIDAHTMICMCGGLEEYLNTIQIKF